MMMESDHPLSLIADYVLDLLPAEERRRVESHVRQCAGCRVALQRERGIETLVRGTVHQAGRPAPGRLAALRPALPAPRPRPLSLYGRLAPAAVVFLMALGLLFGRGSPPFTPAVFADGTPTLTATNTQTPTATLAAVNHLDHPTTSEPTAQMTLSPGPLRPAPQAAATPIVLTAAP